MSTEIVQVPHSDQEDSHMFGDFARLFSKASNAIVQASDLSKELDQARAEMEQLRHEVRRVLELNETLAQELTQVRNERDEARSQLAQANETIQRVEYALNEEIRTSANLRQDVEGLRRTISDELLSHDNQIRELKERHREEVDGFRRQRDDLGFENEALKHEVFTLRGRLDNIRSALGNVQEQPDAAPVQSVA